jgi:hypothetical protein
VWWLVACAAPGWTEVRTACSLEEGESHPVFWSVAADALTPMPAECSDALGLAFRVDWADLNSSAEQASDPRNAESALVNALYTLIAADLGTIGELMKGTDEGEVIHNDETIGRLVAELGEAAPASRLYAEYIWAVAPRIGLSTNRACVMETDPLRGIQICATFLEDDPTIATSVNQRSGAGAAGTIVHEAFHLSSVENDHILGSCTHDVSWGATYGAEARWLYEWDMNNRPLVATQDWSAASSIRNKACVSMEDRENWPPCEGSLTTLCDPTASETPIR